MHAKEWARHLVSRVSPAVRRAVEPFPAAERLLRAMKRAVLPPATPPGVVIVRPEAVAAIKMEGFRELLARNYGVKDLESIEDPLICLWRDFALTTVQRGAEVANQVAAITPIAGKRYLDVGCAYGGFVVAFHLAGARESVGIEINPGLLQYARTLVAENAIPCRLEVGDALDLRQREALGRFDLVTCNDVIEHVADPARGLEALASLLAPGGTLFMAIPNRLNPGFLREDGHFKIFGITALPKPRADAYFRSVLGDAHDVTYESCAFYLNHLRRLGLEARVELTDAARARGILGVIASEFAETRRACDRATPRGDADLFEEARRRVRRAAGVFARAHARYARLSRTAPAEADALALKIVRTFGPAFWNVIAHRPVAANQRDGTAAA